MWKPSGTAVAIAIAMVVAVQPSSAANFLTGSSLKAGLAAYGRLEAGAPLRPEDNWSGYTAVGYILGVFDFLDRTGQTCAPIVTTNIGKVTGVVAKYLEEHPDQLAGAGDAIVARALKTAFPCPARAAR